MKAILRGEVAGDIAVSENALNSDFVEGQRFEFEVKRKRRAKKQSQWTPSTKQYRLNHDNNWKNKEHSYVYKGRDVHKSARQYVEL